MTPCSLRQVRRNPSVVNRLAGAGATEPPSESAPGVPAWVAECARPHFHYVSAGFDAACAMDVVLFQRRVEETYATVFEELKSTGCSFPVRFWVFVPGIHDELDAGLDRYMAFNAGRYSAFAGSLEARTEDRHEPLRQFDIVLSPSGHGVGGRHHGRQILAALPGG